MYTTAALSMSLPLGAMIGNITTHHDCMVNLNFLSYYFGAHCNENPIYVLPEKELRGLSPNFHIHVSVSDLYIP